jgi:hypothetical protein
MRPQNKYDILTLLSEFRKPNSDRILFLTCVKQGISACVCAPWVRRTLWTLLSHVAPLFCKLGERSFSKGEEEKSHDFQSMTPSEGHCDKGHSWRVTSLSSSSPLAWSPFTSWDVGSF